MPVNQILTWLQLMSLKYELDEENQTFKLIYKVNGQPLNAFIVARLDGWIKIRVLLADINDIPVDNRQPFMMDLLQQNFINDDVTFSMDHEGKVYSENDMQKTSNLDGFYTELNAVIYGATLFIKSIAPKYNLIGKLLHAKE